MSRQAVLGLALVFALTSTGQAQEDTRGVPVSHAGLSLGYRAGFGIQASGMVSNFTPRLSRQAETRTWLHVAGRG